MTGEPLKGKIEKINGVFYFIFGDIRDAYYFYTSYCANASRLKKEHPEYWKEWMEYHKKDRMASFDEWLLDYSFQDVLKCF
jgi:hypothetical protein